MRGVAPGPRWAHRASWAAFFSSTSRVSRRPQTSSTLEKSSAPHKFDEAISPKLCKFYGALATRVGSCRLWRCNETPGLVSGAPRPARGQATQDEASGGKTLANSPAPQNSSATRIHVSGLCLEHYWQCTSTLTQKSVLALPLCSPSTSVLSLQLRANRA